VSVGSGGTGQAQGLPLREGLGRRLLAKHLSLDTLLGKNEHGGLARAGRCGGAAPAQGRAEGITAGVSGQGSVVRGWLAEIGAGNDQGMVAALGIREGSLVYGCSLWDGSSSWRVSGNGRQLSADSPIGSYDICLQKTSA